MRMRKKSVGWSLLIGMLMCSSYAISDDTTSAPPSFVTGPPAKLEPYGFSSWTPKGALFMIRNRNEKKRLKFLSSCFSLFIFMRRKI